MINGVLVCDDVGGCIWCLMMNGTTSDEDVYLVCDDGRWTTSDEDVYLVFEDKRHYF